MIFEDRAVAIEPGDTVASALFRAGVRVFRRGLLCGSGNCANCEMTIDGEVNTKACMTRARLGQMVRRPVDQALPIAASRTYEHIHLFTDVAVIGAGPSGIRAALQAAETGKRVYLVEREPAVGGGQRILGIAVPKPEHRNLTVLTDASCFGLYEGNLLGIQQADVLIHLRAEEVVVATGTYETMTLFENSHLPGVMLSSAVLRLIHLHRIRPGRPAVVIEAGGRSEEVVNALRAVDTDVEVVPLDSVVEAIGAEMLDGVRTTHRSIPCELAVVCGSLLPETGLLAEAGAQLAWSAHASSFIPAKLPDGVKAVGSVMGIGTNVLTPQLSLSEDQIVCSCMQISLGQIREALHAGFRHPELLKRATKAGKGHCQGKMCGQSLARIMSSENRHPIEESAPTVSRSPNPAVALGVLAGPRHNLIRRTPLHHLHDALGAQWMDMGAWKRPHSYRCPTGNSATDALLNEYQAVREGVGVIDISTLGKLDIRGRDTVHLLNKVYTGSFASLKEGRTRYGLICDEAGILLDDGTVSRLQGDRYFITTTTGNLEFVETWLKWWSAGTGWDVQITNLTPGLASVNVAGPQARSVLSKLTAIDLASESFPYMSCAEALVAGVQATLLRIGFVGETGWEIHVPAGYGAHLWRSVLEAGEEFGIHPFGIECQRLLRLEKAHVIVGVDTDATSNPVASGLGWAVRMEKPDFVGRAAIRRFLSQPPSENLVGLELEDAQAPDDGTAILRGGRPVGRITSSRYSPACGKSIGLAWIPAGMEEQVEIGGRMARIVREPFYDPSGSRMRQ